MSDKIFANGIFFSKPDSSAPSFVLGKLKIKADEAIQFIKDNQNEAGWLTLEIKNSREGKAYLEVNNYRKPEAAAKPAKIQPIEEEEPPF